MRLVKGGKCSDCPLLSHSRLSKNIGGSSENLAEVRQFVKSIADECGFSERATFDLQVAVGEAVANAVEHGSPFGPESCINVDLTCDGKTLVVQVKDEGRFKKRMPSPDGMNFRGRGIPIMLSLMDRVTVDETPTGTCVILSKRISKAKEKIV